MSGIPFQSGIIYGPILSRRLGRSLGINLLPSGKKVCSFDCVYCQYGRTRSLTSTPNRSILPTSSEVFQAVEKALKKPRSLDYLTFSGNGEPTIHPEFCEIVEGVKRIKDRLRPEVRLAILSNSSRVTDPQIRRALQMIDVPLMKLDAGDDKTFRAINQPVTGLHLNEIIEGLQALPDLMVQSVLIDGIVSNIHGDAYEAWAVVLSRLRPSSVQIYSTERPAADGSVICVTPKRLKTIKADLSNRFGLQVEAYWQA